MNINDLNFSEYEINKFWIICNKGAEDTCWKWSRALDNKGYGVLTIRGIGQKAHRIAYVIAFKELPDKKIVAHMCHAKNCCNPKHLSMVDYVTRTAAKPVEFVKEELNIVSEKPVILTTYSISALDKLRFEKFYTKTDGCWRWNSHVGKDGYGYFFLNGKSVPSHIIAYVIKNGNYAKNLIITRNCQFRDCVNPDHLILSKRGKPKVLNPKKVTKNAKLEINQVKIIKRRLLNGESAYIIAKDYNMTGENISKIRDGKSWKDVEPTSPDLQNMYNEDLNNRSQEDDSQKKGETNGTL